MVQITIENVVGAGGLDTEFNLEKMAEDLDTPVHRYNAEVYPGLYIKFKDDGPLVTLYRTGKYNITGATSVGKIKQARNELLKVLDNLGIEYSAESDPFAIKNFVCVTDLNRQLNLDNLALALGLEYVEYEPEQFPGLIFRPPDFGVVFLLFTSGKAVITGLSNFESVREAAKYLDEKTNI